METLSRFVQGGRASLFGRQPNPLRWLAAQDFAGLVAKTYAQGEMRETFYVYGPQALTMRQALQTYCDALHPGLKVSSLPFWMAGMLAALSGSQELKQALSFFRYIEKTAESTGTEQQLGSPSTTLQAWVKQHSQP